jgi:hypothetical protein
MFNNVSNASARALRAAALPAQPSIIYYSIILIYYNNYATSIQYVKIALLMLR